MTDLLGFLPFAIAAADARVDDVPARQWVAGGTTLLQRCAPLVRALADGESAVLVDSAAALLLALAASVGRGALLLNPDLSAEDVARECHRRPVRAVFTTRAVLDRVPPTHMTVLLDDAPRSALFLREGQHGADQRTVDLGSHHGILVEGSRETLGHPDPCVIFTGDAALEGLPTSTLSHRDIMTVARNATVGEHTGRVYTTRSREWCTPTGFLASFAVPLLSGATVTTDMSGRTSVDIL